MKNQITLQTMAILTLMFFALGSLVAPREAQARWHDKSDELPGMYDISTELVVLGVVAAAAITYAVVKHNKRADSPESAPAVVDTVKAQRPDSTAQESRMPDPRSDTDRPLFDHKESKWTPFAGVAFLTDNSSTGPRFDMSKVEIKAGMRFSF